MAASLSPGGPAWGASRRSIARPNSRSGLGSWSGPLGLSSPRGGPRSRGERQKVGPAPNSACGGHRGGGGVGRAGTSPRITTITEAASDPNGSISIVENGTYIERGFEGVELPCNRSLTIKSVSDEPETCVIDAEVPGRAAQSSVSSVTVMTV